MGFVFRQEEDRHRFLKVTNHGAYVPSQKEKEIESAASSIGFAACSAFFSYGVVYVCVTGDFTTGLTF